MAVGGLESVWGAATRAVPAALEDAAARADGVRRGLVVVRGGERALARPKPLERGGGGWVGGVDMIAGIWGQRK